MAELGENAVDFSSCPDRDSVRLVILRDIAHLNLPLPRHSNVESRPVVVGGAACSQSKRSGRDRPCCFGVPLQQVQHTTCVELFPGCCELVPRPVVKMIDYLGNHLTEEGLFRKTGSLLRQKELRAALCSPEPLPNDCNVHDVANLLKLYLRELPECLLSKEWLPSFLEVARRYRNEPEKLSEHILDLCLLLSTSSFNVLRYIVSFFHRVASYSTQNLMDVDNLAVIVTPNVIPSHVSSVAPNALSLHTSVVRCLIDKAPKLGRISIRRSNEARKLPVVMGSCRRKQPMRRAKLKPWSSLDCLDDRDNQFVNEHDTTSKRPVANRVTTIFSSIGQTISRFTPKNHRRFVDSPDTFERHREGSHPYGRPRRYSADDVLDAFRDERITSFVQQTNVPKLCADEVEVTRHAAVVAVPSSSTKRRRDGPEENTPPKKRSFSPRQRDVKTSSYSQQDDGPVLAGEGRYDDDQDDQSIEQHGNGLLTPLIRSHRSRASLLAMQGAKEEAFTGEDPLERDNLKHRLQGLRKSVRRNVKSHHTGQSRVQRKESPALAPSSSVGSRLASAGTKLELKQWPVYI